MGYAPIQTMPFVVAQPLLYVRIINHSIRTTPFCVGLHHRFYHQAATPDAYGQLLHNALLFGHSKGDLNPIPPAYASVLSTYTILLRHNDSPYELSLCSPIFCVDLLGLNFISSIVPISGNRQPAAVCRTRTGDPRISPTAYDADERTRTSNTLSFLIGCC